MLSAASRRGSSRLARLPSAATRFISRPTAFTLEYLSSSFTFFRRAKADCAQVFEAAKDRNLRSFVFFGKSDLAEVAILSALENGISVVAIVDKDCEQDMFAGTPVVHVVDDLPSEFDAVVITDVRNSHELFDEAVQLFGPERVFAPALLGLIALKHRESRQ
jgi:hypothetical protein